MIKLLKYLKGSAALCAIIAPLAMMIEVAMDLLQPMMMSNIIDIGVANGDLNYVLSMGIKMVAIAVIGAIGGMLCSAFAAVASMSMAQNLRQGVFDRIQTLSFLEIDHFKTSSLITRLTNDVTQVQTMLNMTLKIAVRAPLLCIGGIIMAISLSPKLSTVFAIAIPMIVVGIIFILKKSFPLFTSLQYKIDKINNVMRENILGIRVIKSFNLEDKQKASFSEANQELTESSIASQNMNLLLWPFATLIMNLSVVGILWFGGNMVNVGELQIGKIMAFINYLTQIMHSTIMVINIMMNFSRAKASANRINEVLDTKSSIQEVEEAQTLHSFDIEFKNVSFRYNLHSEDVLSHISFKIPEGQTVGIIGSTGCGKSSFVQLIPRLYDATEGEILIGGVNVKEIRLKELRDHIGVVLQENILFSGTIEENLLFGNQKADEEMMQSSSQDAQAYEFISAKEDGYKSKVEQRGKNLSGGQKQRLSIARTLIKNPKILILDDSSSALDMATEAKLQQSIKSRMKNATVLMIAQRISAVMEADQIIVINEGEIVASGTHQELLMQSDIYRNIAISQLGEEVVSHG